MDALHTLRGVLSCAHTRCRLAAHGGRTTAAWRNLEWTQASAGVPTQKALAINRAAQAARHQSKRRHGLLKQ